LPYFAPGKDDHLFHDYRSKVPELTRLPAESKKLIALPDRLTLKQAALACSHERYCR
jgi:hypothetical protein